MEGAEPSSPSADGEISYSAFGILYSASLFDNANLAKRVCNGAKREKVAMEFVQFLFLLPFVDTLPPSDYVRQGFFKTN